MGTRAAELRRAVGIYARSSKLEECAVTGLRKSLAISFVQQYSITGLQVISVMVLARLLTPTEVGIYSSTLAVVELAHVLRNFGLANYLVQEKDLTDLRIRTATTFGMVLGWSMGIGMLVASGPIARFYHEPGVGHVLRVLSVLFFIIPISSPIFALLRREMAFGTNAWISAVSTSVRITTSIALAAAGFSYMSLAWGSIAGAVVDTIAFWFHRPPQFSLKPHFGEWRRISSFGWSSSLLQGLKQLGAKSPDLVMARMIGFSAVGLFSRAQGMRSMFDRIVLTSITRIALPDFSKRVREGKNLRGLHLSWRSHLTVAAWPFFAFLAVMADPIVRLMFGPKWLGAVPILQLLCISGLFIPLNHLTQPLFIAYGKINVAVRVGLLIEPLRIAIIIVGSLYSVTMVALLLVIPSFINTIIIHGVLARMLKYSVLSIFEATYKSMIVALISAGVTFAMRWFLEIQGVGVIFLTLVVSAATALAWLGGVFLVGHPIKEEVLSLLKVMRPFLLRTSRSD